MDFAMMWDGAPPKRNRKPVDLFALAEQDRLPKRYDYLELLVEWVDNLPGEGTPNISGFHNIVVAYLEKQQKTISYKNFYIDHYKKLVKDGCLQDRYDPIAKARALIVLPKARDILASRRRRNKPIRV